MLNNSRTPLTSLAIFLLITITLGIPFTQWGFKTDDFGNLYRTTQIKNVNDFINLFHDKSIEGLYYPSGSAQPPSSFISGLYRPISFIYYWPQYYFFGTNAYGYYLVTIALHALNSLLFFLLLLFFLPYSLALLGSLLFGFHPSLHNWLGWISAQTYQSELLVFSLLLFCLKKYLDPAYTKATAGKLPSKHIFYPLSLTLYAMNLWLKEATFMLPLWIMPATWLYLKDAKKSIQVSIGFCFVSISYFISRAIVFGFASTGNPGNLTFDFTWHSFITRQKERLFDVISYVSDMLGLCWLPGNNQVLKGAMIVSIFCILFFLFIKSKQKLLLLFFYASTLLFSWPALLMHYQPRYLYLALPFFIAAVLVSVRPINRYMTVTLFTLLITFNALFLIKQLKIREKALHQVTTAFTTLIKENPISNKPLYFFALPHHWFAMSIAQAIWFLSGDDRYPVYHNGSVVEVTGFHNYLGTPQTNNASICVTPTSNGFALQSTNPEIIWFEAKKDCMEISIPPEILEQKPLFITWDYQHAKFIQITR